MLYITKSESKPKIMYYSEFHSQKEKQVSIKMLQMGFVILLIGMFYIINKRIKKM